MHDSVRRLGAEEGCRRRGAHCHLWQHGCTCIGRESAWHRKLVCRPVWLQHAGICSCWQITMMTFAAGLLQPGVPALSPAAVQAARPRSSLYVCASGAERCRDRQHWGRSQWARLQHERHGQPQRAMHTWPTAGLAACQAEGVGRTANSATGQAARACSLQRRLLLLLPGLTVLQHQPAPAYADGGLSRYVKKRR